VDENSGSENNDVDGGSYGNGWKEAENLEAGEAPSSFPSNTWTHAKSEIRRAIHRGLIMQSSEINLYIYYNIITLSPSRS